MSIRRQIRLVAFDRPDYLKEVAASIKQMRGVQGFEIVCSVDALPTGGHNPQVVALCQGLGGRVILRDRMDCNRHVIANLREVLDDGVLELLYLEDDVVPARDCLEFCLDHAPAVKAHPGIKVISLLGQEFANAYTAWRAIDAFKVHKWFSPWGNYWLRDGLQQALAQFKPEWLEQDQPTWDARIQMNMFVDHDWLSLTPFVSRVRNIGVTGRYTRTPKEHRSRHRHFWSDSDFTVPLRAGWH